MHITSGLLTAIHCHGMVYAYTSAKRYRSTDDPTFLSTDGAEMIMLNMHQQYKIYWQGTHKL